jgi:cation transporter-like permease
MDQQLVLPAFYDFAFYAAAWAIAAFCGLLSTYIDRRNRDVCELLAIGAVSGWLGVGTIGVLVRTTGGTIGYEPYYFAVAVMVGLLGKQGLYIATWSVTKIMKQMGIDEDAVKKNSGTDSSDTLRPFDDDDISDEEAV